MGYMVSIQVWWQPNFLHRDQVIPVVLLNRVFNSALCANIEFVHFSAATLARTRKAKVYSEMRMTGMRLAQSEGKAWNLLQCLRDREVRRQNGEQLDIRLLEGAKKAGSISSFGGADSVGEGRTRGRKRHSSPAQSSQRGHIRQQGSRHHADRFRTSQTGLEHWTVTPEEFLANHAWEQANPHRLVNRRGEHLYPSNDEEGRSDGVASNTSSFEYERKPHSRYSSDGGPLSPQVSMGSPLAKSSSLKLPLRNVPSFAMSSASLARSRSPSPTRNPHKHSRQTSDLLDIPQRVRKKLQEKIKGDRSGLSSRSHSPNRSDTSPAMSRALVEMDISKVQRSSTLPQNIRLNIDILARRPTISRRPKYLLQSAESEAKRELSRTRARLISTGITARAMLSRESHPTSISKCQHLMGRIAGLNRSITTSFDQDHLKATTDLTTMLSNLESRQTQIANHVQSALIKTRTETAVQIADIASQQTSTLLLQIKAVEDKMDALEYRTNSGWTHEKTLHLVFLVLEYIVMVVLWHLWVLLSVLRVAKQVVFGVWMAIWVFITGIINAIRWLLFLYP
jgi:hypothetical protein